MINLRVNRIIPFVAAALLTFMANNSWAANYYLSTQGDNRNSGTSWADAWGGMAHAAESLSPGDTLIVAPGEYAGPQNKLTLIDRNAGDRNSLIVIRAKSPDEHPVLKRTDSEESDTAIHIGNSRYIVIDGIDVDGEVEFTGRQSDQMPRVGQWCRISDGSHHITIRNCVWRKSRTSGLVLENDCHSNVIRNNQLLECAAWDASFKDPERLYPGRNPDDKQYPFPYARPETYRDFGIRALGVNAGDNFKLYGQRNLIENNKIDRGSHTPLNSRGKYNVIRGNTVTNTWGEFFVEGHPEPVPFGNRLCEFTSDVADHPEHGFCLIENNVFAGAGASPDQRQANVGAVKVQGVNQIFRRNFLFDNVYGCINTTARNGFRRPEAIIPKCLFNRIYNNTMHNNGGHAYKHSIAGGSMIGIPPKDHDFNIFANNIISDYHWSTETEANSPEFANDFIFLGRDFSNGELLNNTVLHNLSDTWNGRPTRIFFAGLPDGENQTLSWAETNFPENFRGNIEEEPEFLSNEPQSTKAFQLDSDSPCIDAGAFLVHTVGDGIDSVTMEVDDAYSFFAGLHDIGAGGENVAGDTIQLQGQSTTAEIVSISYNDYSPGYGTGGVLTLDTPMTWKHGDGVFLPYNGNAPDIGAREFMDSGE